MNVPYFAAVESAFLMVYEWNILIKILIDNDIAMGFY